MKPIRFSRFLTLPAVLLLGGLTALVGCKPKYPACKKDEDCKAELAESCVEGTCQVPGAEGAPAGGGEEGDPCAQRTDCFGGLACKQGVCAWCSDDIDCAPGACNLDTGRCSPEGACQTDQDCAMDEICDGGMCLFSGDLGDDSGGPCGLAAVYFAFDSEILTPKTEEELANVADCITQQDRRVFLEAHADNRGTEEYNILLTERRGNVVRRFLTDRGVPGENLQVIAKGSLEAVGNDEPTRAKERRVQFIWP